MERVFIPLQSPYRHRHRLFWLPGGVRSPSPSELGIVIEDFEHILARLKCLGLTRALKIWDRVTGHPRIKAPVTVEPLNSGTSRPNLPKFYYMT